MADREARSFDVRRHVAEAVGTFMLVALGPGATMVSGKTGAFGHTGVALEFGLVVCLVIASAGHSAVRTSILL